MDASAFLPPPFVFSLLVLSLNLLTISVTVYVSIKCFRKICRLENADGAVATVFFAARVTDLFALLTNCFFHRVAVLPVSASIVQSIIDQGTLEKLQVSFESFSFILQRSAHIGISLSVVFIYLKHKKYHHIRTSTHFYLLIVSIILVFFCGAYIFQAFCTVKVQVFQWGFGNYSVPYQDDAVYISVVHGVPLAVLLLSLLVSSRLTVYITKKRKDYDPPFKPFERVFAYLTGRMCIIYAVHLIWTVVCLFFRYSGFYIILTLLKDLISTAPALILFFSPTIRRKRQSGQNITTVVPWPQPTAQGTSLFVKVKEFWNVLRAWVLTTSPQQTQVNTNHMPTRPTGYSMWNSR